MEEKMKKIQFFIEDETGHSTLNVPENKVQEEVEKQLTDEKWVTTEKENGDTEILTKEDIPKSATQKVLDTSKVSTSQSSDDEWAEKFKNVKSATATKGAKGG